MDEIVMDIERQDNMTMKIEKTLRFKPQLGYLDETRLPTDSEETVVLKELLI